MQMIQLYIYACHKNIDNVIWSLENDSTVIIQWFTDNFMKLNPDKCHFMVLGKSSNQDVTVNVGSSIIKNTKQEKLLGVMIDKKLTFETHINKLCKKAGNKLFALSRMSPYMNSNKLQFLMRAFVMSQFQYCQLAYKDYVSSFDILLEREKSVTIHTKNLQTLMIEIFKTQNNMNHSFMNEIFREQVNMHNLRNNNELVLPRIKTVNFGSESSRYRGPQLWFSLPQDRRNTESISLFKSKIKKWHGEDCSCRLCRPFIPNVRFL